MDVLSVMINIIYEDNHLLVVEKPVNIPVQLDSSNDLDFLTILKEDIKKRYHKPGNVYLGLIHRLDRPVGGIMVFAKTSKAASRLSDQIRTHTFQKIYHAVVLGKIEKKGHYVDYLLKDHKKNMVSINAQGKKSVLDYEMIKQNNDLSLVKIYLKTGRSHQIRVQFASRNHPLYGDQRYNNQAKIGQQIALFASSITFIHPTTKERMHFELTLPDRVPWNLF